MQLFGFKHSYPISIIFKHIYFTHRWNPNRYYHSKSEWNLRVTSMKGYFILLRAPKPEPHYWIQLSIIVKTLAGSILKPKVKPTFIQKSSSWDFLHDCDPQIHTHTNFSIVV